MARFVLINELYLKGFITEKEYHDAMTGYLENLSPDETSKVFANSAPCPHFYLEYPESEQGFTHFCRFCPEDFTFKKE